MADTVTGAIAATLTGSIAATLTGAAGVIAIAVAAGVT